MMQQSPRHSTASSPPIPSLAPLTVGLAAIALLCATLGAAPVAALQCDTDVVPAATLLVPYFEVDLERPDERTTLFSVTNEETAPVLVNVVLWTEWAIPTLSFEVYLAGFDVQSVNLRDIFVHGRLPSTGSGVSPHGALSTAPVEFPGCNPGTTPGTAPVYPVPALGPDEVARLQAFHTGECFEGQRAGLPASGDLNRAVRGYVTVDVVERCSGLTPADPGYFGADGVAGDRNVLTGDYFLVDSGENFAQGEQAVHVESFPGGFASGDYTFYKRHVGGTGIDNREPLGTQYSVRHLVGGAFDGGTEYLVWRDPGSPDAEPVGCSELPGWYEQRLAFAPAGLASYTAVISEDGATRDFEETPFPCVILPPCGEERTFPLATQAVAIRLPDPLRFGKTHINLRKASTEDPAEWEILQGWVTVTHRAEGRLSVGQRAIRLDSACDPGPVLIRPDDVP